MFFLAAIQRLQRLRDNYRKTNPKKRRPKLNGYNLVSNPIPEREEFKGYQRSGHHEVELPRLSARRNDGYNANEQNQIERFLKVSKDKSDDSKDSERIFQNASKSVKIEIVKFNYERDLTKVIMDLKTLREQMDHLLLSKEQDDLEHFIQKKEVYPESEFSASHKNIGASRKVVPLIFSSDSIAQRGTLLRSSEPEPLQEVPTATALNRMSHKREVRAINRIVQYEMNNVQEESFNEMVEHNN